MTTRREFMAISGAAVAVAGLPTMTMAASTKEHPLIANVKRHYELLRKHSVDKNYVISQHEKIALKINRKLIAEHEMFNNPELYMTAPMTDHNGVIVAAKTRRFEVRYTLDMATDAHLPELTHEMIQDQIVDCLATEMSAELSGEIARSPGVIFYPYMPVISNLTPYIDPIKLEPCITFDTRYGTIL